MKKYALLNKERIISITSEIDEYTARKINAVDVTNFNVKVGMNISEVLKNPSALREQAYKTMLYAENGNPLILWDSEPITIDAANDLWAKYAAENHPDANILQELIKAAKEYIRGLYPDEVD